MSYKQDVRDELDVHQDKRLKFRDKHGFVIDLIDPTKDQLGDETPETLGEGTYHTAIAAIAIATGNYSQDEWEKASANQLLSELLRTLLEKAWGNEDHLGRVHPVRHADLYDYDKDRNKLRLRPLSKDSFAPITAAIYYAYKCPHSTDEVRSLALQLCTKWAEYLIEFQWRTHSIYIEGEFEQDGVKYRNLYNGKESNEQNNYVGPDGFMLYPHEIYAFQNVASAVGMPAATWNPWVNLGIEIQSAIVDYVALYMGDLAGRSFRLVLDQLNLSIPVEIPLGPDDWNLGKIKWNFEIEIPDHIKDIIEDRVKSVVTDVLREFYRLQKYKDEQSFDLMGLVLNKILDLFPQELSRDSWRTVLTDGIQKVLPWITGSIWNEASAFLLVLAKMRLGEEQSNISFTSWAFAVECENRVEIRTFLTPAIEQYYDFIKNHNNPNGLWAWLAGDSTEVRRQLVLFESNDPRNWNSFAYGPDDYNKWSADLAGHSQKKSSRIDYLVLDGLFEKGAPKTVDLIIGDLYEKVRDIIQDIIDRIVSGIKDNFKKFGQYTMEKLNEAGQMIRETWNEAMEFKVEVLVGGNIIEQKVVNKIGENISHWAESGVERIEEYWNKGEKYWKGTWKKIGNDYKMIARSIINADDVLTDEYWDRGPEKYVKETWRKIGNKLQVAERLTILDDKSIIEACNDAGEWGKSVYDKAGKLIESTGILDPNIYNPANWRFPNIDLPRL